MYVRISINISLKFVPKGPINNIPALVQIMAGRHLGDKPLSESMLVSLLTHIYASPGLNESKLIVVCRLCVIYVREGNDSNVQAMITRLIWTTWTSLSAVRERLLNLITHLLNENVRISIKISLKFVPLGSDNNITALVEIMAWCRPGDKLLLEPMMV